jgi:sortase A
MAKALRIVGACLVAYGGITLLRGEPLTGLYARFAQRQLAAELSRQVQVSGEARSPGESARPARRTADGNPRPARRAPDRKPAGGEPLGRILIPRIGLNAVFVEGTGADDLRRAPGHYEVTALPGAGKTVAIAGHRTTYGAFFRHIDELRTGDVIALRLAYGEFRYVVFGHRIVDRRDWSIIRPRRFETLVLSACHPLYSAAQRWVVFARLVRPSAARQPPARAAAARASAS